MQKILLRNLIVPFWFILIYNHPCDCHVALISINGRSSKRFTNIWVPCKWRVAIYDHLAIGLHKLSRLTTLYSMLNDWKIYMCNFLSFFGLSIVIFLINDCNLQKLWHVESLMVFKHKFFILAFVLVVS